MERIDLLKRCEQNAHYSIYNYLINKMYEQMELLINNENSYEETIIILNFIQSEIKKIEEKIDHDEKTEA